MNPASAEWRAYIEPLLPLGERLAQQLHNSDDPRLRQELYRVIVSQISSAYFGLLYADPRHPDFWPVFNEAYCSFAPNPDFMYYLTPIEGDGNYRISGYRGTVHKVDLQVAGGTLLPYGHGNFGPSYANYDLDMLAFGADGAFEVLLSKQRPAGYQGDWWLLDGQASYILVRQIALDWSHEADARLAIDRLDTPAIRPRPTAQETDARLRLVAEWAQNFTGLVFKWIAGYLKNAPMNQVHVRTLAEQGGVANQFYAEGQFELAPDEALVFESEVPSTSRYWSLQVHDMLMVSIDYMHRQSSLNAYSAIIDSDGKFRAVICASDPGVPNWLDTAGHRRGGLLGRWTDAGSAPAMSTTKVKLADLRQHLPADTLTVTPAARDAAIRERRKGAQLRRRW